MVRILSRRRRTRISLNVVHLYPGNQLKKEICCKARNRDRGLRLLSFAFLRVWGATISAEKNIVHICLSLVIYSFDDMYMTFGLIFHYLNSLLSL